MQYIATIYKTAMQWTVKKVNSFPFTWKEWNFSSQHLSGFNNFIAMACFDWKNLDETTKCEFVLQALTIAEPENNDINMEEMGLDSSDFTCFSVANKLWGAMEPELKDSWNAKAVRLNSRPCYGKFEELPYYTINYGLEKLVQDTLVTDWKVYSIHSLLYNETINTNCMF